jgi:uncharacterized protein
MLIWSAFILGLLGNIHCLGMCGPIALLLPLKRGGFFTKILSITLYNLGRILTYTLFGALFGLFGRMLELAGFQQYFSLVMGGVIIVGLFLPYYMKKTNIVACYMYICVGKIKGAFKDLLKNRSYFSLFSIGVLNGLLPCGMVYMALAGAVLAGSWYMGALYMAVFGVGTIPVMFAMPYIGGFIKDNIKLRFRKIVPVTVLIFGVLLMLRGANLGIPYLSPKMQTEKSCCADKCH